MRAVALVLPFVLVGCSSPAREAVEKQLIDPGSARFERVRECPSQKGMYSGFVNSKNRNGAYAGSIAFFVEGGTVTYVDDYSFNDRIKKCFGEEGVGATEMAVGWLRYVDPSRPHSRSADITK